ncbi:hypothetical protein FQZ97_819890 [compost metagenome]
MASAARRRRMAKLKVIAVLKAMVARVPIRLEGWKEGAISIQAWARPQPRDDSRITPQCRSSQSFSSSSVPVSGGRWSKRAASNRPKKMLPPRPTASCCAGSALNCQQSSQARR